MGPAENNQTAKDLLDEAVDVARKAAPKSRAGNAAPKGKGRKKAPAQDATRDVVVQGVSGPVTYIDKSVNVQGDEATIAGNAAPSLPEGAVDLMGEINEAIDAVYKALKRELSLAELGRVGIEKHASIIAACRHPDEFPHAIAIMKLRLRRELEEAGNEPAKKR